MYKVYLKTPGFNFMKPDGNLVRTPIRFLIPDSQKTLIETMLKTSSIEEYEITETDEEFPIPSHRKIGKNRPKSSINLNFKLQG